MNKPILLTIASKSEGVDKYINSLHNLKNGVEVFRFQYDPIVEDAEARIKDQGITDLKLKPIGLPYPGNGQRWDCLEEGDIDPARFYIHTDFSDVIFQFPIPELNPEKIYLSYEGVTFEENNYWRMIIGNFPFLKPLNKRPIFNVGTFAMNGKRLLEWISFVKDFNKNNPGLNHDQPKFNLWLLDKYPSDEFVIHPTLFTTLYADVGLQKTFYIKERGFFNKHDELYSIVHANGSLKFMLKDYE